MVRSLSSKQTWEVGRSQTPREKPRWQVTIQAWPPRVWKDKHQEVSAIRCMARVTSFDASTPCCAPCGFHHAANTMRRVRTSVQACALAVYMKKRIEKHQIMAPWPQPSKNRMFKACQSFSGRTNQSPVRTDTDVKIGILGGRGNRTKKEYPKHP